MPTISGVLASFPLMPSPKLFRGGSIINNNSTHFFHNFGANFPYKVSRLQVKVDDVQDPYKINDFQKDHELEKRRYAYDEYVVRQDFLVRLYELDIHQKASLEALLNYTEETGLNLFQSSGLVVRGFGVSKEMTSRNLIWVIGRMQVVVNSYPSWGDIVQVETWCSGLGKHCLTCSSRLTNAKSGKKLMRVDSEFVMINEKTRRLSKLPEEIKARGDPYVREDLDPLLHKYDKLRKLQKLDEEKAGYIQTGIKPLWFDLDPNQHVNNVKYISWILEDHEFEKRSYACEDYVVRQDFLVRLYELDIHQKASLEALLNYTEETALNLFQSSGLMIRGFGVSKEMTSRNLIWVIGRIQVVVNSYPSWGDLIQVESWISRLGKHCITCSSRLRDRNSGKKLMRVDSEYMMINEKTRRLSKLHEEIKVMEPYVREDLDPLLHKYDKLGKLRKLNEEKAGYIQTGIKPLWFDLDPNQHVNNVKYISWILEGTLERVRENYELEAITLEYRRECGRENVLQSLSSAVASTENPREFDHLLRLENGTEVARARTLWRPKGVY